MKNARQAKRAWEKKYNVLVTITGNKVNVISLDDLTQSVDLCFVPPFMGEFTSWFDSAGARVDRPGLAIRRMALTAKKTRRWREAIK